jgi:hypothetical protein
MTSTEQYREYAAGLNANDFQSLYDEVSNAARWNHRPEARWQLEILENLIDEHRAEREKPEADVLKAIQLTYDYAADWHKRLSRKKNPDPDDLAICQGMMNAAGMMARDMGLYDQLKTRSTK